MEQCNIAGSRVGWHSSARLSPRGGLLYVGLSLVSFLLGFCVGRTYDSGLVGVSKAAPTEAVYGRFGRSWQK